MSQYDRQEGESAEQWYERVRAARAELDEPFRAAKRAKNEEGDDPKDEEQA